MPRVAFNGTKTRIIKLTQKNGDIYVIERVTQYIPERKYNKVISSKLIGKIVKGDKKIVSTRPKRKNSPKVDISTSNVESYSEGKLPVIQATRKNVGMMDILEQVGKVSGIDEGIYSSTDIGTAKKVLSLARYLVASNGQTFPGITTFQLNHPLPYEEWISEDCIHELLDKIGLDESFQQNFFLSRCIRRPNAL